MKQSLFEIPSFSDFLEEQRFRFIAASFASFPVVEFDLVRRRWTDTLELGKPGGRGAVCLLQRIYEIDAQAALEMLARLEKAEKPGEVL